MHIFYNRQGIGDTLIISLQECSRLEIDFEKKDNVCRIYNVNTNQTIGFNLFNFSSFKVLDVNGLVEPTEKLIESLNEVIKKQGFSDRLTNDSSPKFVVGKVLEKMKHPNADKLSVCKVDIGDETLQIVCGAPNVEEDQKVVVAKVGAVMPSGLIIKNAELRGVDSFGMICSAKELDLPNAPKEKGVLVLNDRYEVGKTYFNN